MTTLQNGNRKISITLNTTTFDTNSETTKNPEYIITLPVICCNNEDDAKAIQTATDEFVFKLVKETLAKEEDR